MFSEKSTRDEIREILDTGELSQARMAREIGISGPALSGWLSGKYTGDMDGIERKVEKWLSVRRRKTEQIGSMPTAPDWVPTRTAEKIHAAAAYAQMSGDIAVVYGAAGVGKTHALHRYQSENPNVWLTTMTAAHRGVGPSLEEITFSIGLKDLPMHPARLLRETIRRVQGTGGLLVIDEAQHLLPGALEAIRAIHDASGIGIVLSGNEAVYARLTGGTRTATFAQLYSRVGKRLRLTSPLRTDIWAVARAFGVDGTDCKPICYDIGLKPGGLRAIVKTCRLAGMFAAGGAIGEDHIRAAWKELSDSTVKEEVRA